MDAVNSSSRQQRGLALARTTRIKKLVGDKWLVPSQNGAGSYVVDPEERTCQCEDHRLRLTKCKHLFAVEYARHEITAPDGSQIVTESMRVTYRQDWHTYNAYQCDEKDRVRLLLASLCEGIESPVRRGRGRPRHALGDVVYAATMKTFVGLSGRRASTDMSDCMGMGFMGRAPKYNTIFDYMERPEMTPLLQALVQESATPIAEIDRERAFGLDGTGFSTSVYDRWLVAEHGSDKEEAEKQQERFSLKLTICIGVRSKIITYAVANDGTPGESKLLPMLTQKTAERFKVEEVLADKGYHGLPNLTAIEALGAKAYIPFKDNSRGDGPEIWRRLYHLYMFHRDEFLAHYHQRSNVEGVFSAIKRKFGTHVRAKSLDAMVNEALLKCLCHNLSVLVRAIHELGLDPTFWKNTPKLSMEEASS